MINKAEYILRVTFKHIEYMGELFWKPYYSYKLTCHVLLTGII